MTRPHRLALALLALLLGAASPAAAQEVTGWVVDDSTGQPVPGVTVTLVGSTQRQVGRTQSDAAGRFYFDVPSADRYSLRAARVGYRPAHSDAITVAPKDTVVVELRLSTQSVVLAPLTVMAASASVARDQRMAGFEARRRSGWGRFMTPEEVEKLNPFYVTDLLQHMGNVRVDGGGFRRSVTMRGVTGRCRPYVYVDGYRNRVAEEDGVDSAIPGSRILAIEVYTALTTPAEFASQQLAGSCGVIVIWTKRR
ncbi:MAG TPA: carboxypeptidase regulatory-like domain-containing protein [Longimicrobium sp.]|nr:carboxypeptidase regulatory-like domain-containing protein [Longimicrobium sp.]